MTPREMRVRQGELWRMSVEELVKIFRAKVDERGPAGHLTKVDLIDMITYVEAKRA